MPRSCPLGPVQRHHLLGVGMQQPGQSGAVAAGAVDRPHPLTMLLVRQFQQLLVADRGGRYVAWVTTAPVAAATTAAVSGVLVGVDPDDESTSSARMAMR